MKSACCSHDHQGSGGFSKDIGQFFWMLVAAVAGLWLFLAMEMLRRSRAEREWYTEGCTSHVIDGDIGDRAAEGGHD